MNKDIQTLIEREAREQIEALHPLDKQSLYIDGKYYWEKHFKKGFKAGASFALSLFKWRKVSDELPEEYITVLIKNRTGKIMSVYRCDVNEWCIIGTNDLVNPETIEYWMPIPNND